MKSQTWKIALIVLAFVALPVLFALEMTHLNRTLHARQLVTIAAVVGLIIGIASGYYFQKQASDAVGRMRAFAVNIVLAVLTLPLLAGLSNRLLSFNAVQQVPVEFVEVSPRYSSRFGVGANESVQANSYITFFYKGQELASVHTRHELFPNAKRGDTVTLPIQKGWWGYEIVVQP